MVSPTNVPPNPDNPDRADVVGAGNDYAVSFTAGANANFLRQDGTWALPPGGGGGSVWGGITGTLSNQIDLQNALNLKANTASLALVATTGVYNDLSGKPTLGTVAALSYPGGTSTYLRADGTWATPAAAAWGSITGTLSSQTDLQTALNLKAPLASPSFTGTPLAPAPTIDTNTTQIATTAFVLGQGYNSLPTANGTASAGSALRWTRGDHVHPTDTTRMQNVLTTTGDIVYSSSGSTPARLGVGTNGHVLTLAAGVPTWAAATGGFSNPMTTSGDLILGGVSGAPGRLGIGSNSQVLTVTGGVVGWAAATGGFTNPMTALGDLITGGASGVAGRLGIGSTGQVLQVTAGVPAWGGFSNGPTFSAYRDTSSQSYTTLNTWQTVIFNVKTWDTATAYNNTTGIFTPQTAGRYQVNATVQMTSSAADMTNLQIAIYKNGVIYKRGNIVYTTAGASVNAMEITVSGVVEMNGTTDYLHIGILAVTGTSLVVPVGYDKTWFDAFLITPVVGGSNPAGPTFSASRTSNQTLTSTAALTVLFDSEAWDTASCYAPGTGRFTPNVSGKYQINWSVNASNPGVPITNYQAILYKNGVLYKKGQVLLALAAAGITDINSNGSCVVDMNGSTDYVEVVVFATFASGTCNVTNSSTWFDGSLITSIAGSGGSGDVVGPASSVSGRVATFNGTTGKLIQDGGTLLSALAPLASPAFTSVPTAPTAATGTSTTQLATTAFVQQEKLIPLASKSAAYTGVLADGNTGWLHPSADTTARIFTIPANSSVAYPVGTTLTIVNQNGAGVITIAITTDTMRLAGAGTTGSRTLAANGVATAYKITSTEWIINGTGLT